ncbi:hypothetical protein TNCV_3252411 [Trichonephila clavipes]|nr:hypothetical protein TNCV_3252411 [Trichonephila clavipes]
MISPDCSAGFTASAHAENEGVNEFLRHCCPFVLQRQSKLPNRYWCDEAHFCLNGYVNKQNCRIWSEANPQVYVETSLHPEKLTVWCALWAGGILLQKR